MPRIRDAFSATSMNGSSFCEMSCPYTVDMIIAPVVLIMDAFEDDITEPFMFDLPGNVLIEIVRTINHVQHKIMNFAPLNWLELLNSSGAEVLLV